MNETSEADMQQALEPTQDRDWLLVEQGYDPLRESSVESRFAVSNGFLGVRGSRAISRGPTWVSWLHTLRWASWPRTYVAGLFDTPNTEPPVPALVPVADWLRLRVLLNGKALLQRAGDTLGYRRILDMRRGVMLTEWRQRDPGGIVVKATTLRLVSLADRALGLQLVRLEVEQGDAEVTVDARFDEVGRRARSGTSRAGSRRVAHRAVRQEPGDGLRRRAAIGRGRAVAARARARSDGPGTGRRRLVRPQPSSAWSPWRGATARRGSRPRSTRRARSSEADRLARRARRT